MPSTRYGARPDASKQEPKSVPGTRCDARPDASKTQPGGPSNRCQAPGVAPRSDASKTGGPKSVPGTNCTVVL